MKLCSTGCTNVQRTQGKGSGYVKKRESGILMGISSLPGKYGIGDFGKEAYGFVDFLERSAQSYWQILPLGPTGFGDSPYQSFSAFAGNPYFIDLDELVEIGFLEKSDIDSAGFAEDSRVDYSHIYKEKYRLLRLAFEKSKKALGNTLAEFYDDHSWWLREFSVFMAIKDSQGGKAWSEWDEDLKHIGSPEVQEFEKKESDRIDFWIFTQYFFLKQWLKLKLYANDKGIKIIGDLPIYVSEDSSDLWANPKYFKLDEDLKPITVAGVPPDYFTAKGQLWGNPIYDWSALEESGYDFWIKRIKQSILLYDTIRIDHFRGFESFWEVPYGAEDAVNGKWTKGPGMKLFNKIAQVFGDVDIIAEDLGFQTEEVVELIKATGFPGMKILQFAFDPEGDNDYLPHNHDKNCIVYTGTHDNRTVRDWIETAPKDSREYAIQYLKLDDDEEGYNWGLIRGAWGTNAYLAIAQMQDFLDLGEEGRMNEPATLGQNWTWRVLKEQLTDKLADRISRLTWIYRRCKDDQPRES